MLLALACVLTQQKITLGFSVSFLAATSIRTTRTIDTRPSSHRPDMLQDASNELPLSRSQLLRLVPPGVFAGAVFVAAAKPSFSALPTTEDYAFGTGSKVKTGMAGRVVRTTAVPKQYPGC